MKKTVQTMMTAAMFAATINMIPSGTSAGTVSASATDYNPAVEEFQGVYAPPDTTPVSEETLPVPTTMTTVPATVYGPPIAWNTTTEPLITGFNPEQMTTVAVYGPPIAWNTTTEPVETVPAQTNIVPPLTTIPLPVYGPPQAWIGDLNEDDRLDVFDMIELRKAYIEGVMDWDDLYRADVNQDGKIGIADLVMLQNYLLGKTDNFRDQLPEPVPTEPQKSYVNTTNTTTTTNTVTEPIPEPVYGPPSLFE